MKSNGRKFYCHARHKPKRNRNWWVRLRKLKPLELLLEYFSRSAQDFHGSLRSLPNCQGRTKEYSSAQSFITIYQSIHKPHSAMPKQSDKMGLGCNQDGNTTPTKHFPIELSTSGSLAFSIDSDSTSSTEIDSSFSKHSLSSEEEDDLFTPRSNRDGVFRRLVDYDDDDDEACTQIWLFDDETDKLKISQRPTKSFFRTVFKRYYLLFAFAVCMSLGAIRVSLDSTKDRENWSRFLQEDALRITEQIKRLPIGDSFTIVLRGSRLDLIQQSLDSHSRCPSVSDVVIDFGGMEHIPESLLSHRTGKARNLGNLVTKGLLLLDEGVVLSCEEIEKGFSEWKRDPRRLVGFFGYRSADSADTQSKLSGALAAELVPSGSGPYSMISDRAMFIHHHYIDSLPDSEDSSCCHLLLSMQVTALSSQAPLVVRSNPRQLLDVLPSPAGSSLRGIYDSQTSECGSSCVPRWMRPTLSNLLVEEGKTILA